MLLTWIIFLPLAGALPLLLVRDRNGREIKVWAFLISFATFSVSLPLWFSFDPEGPLYQFVEQHRWIELKGLKVGYHLGADGISALLILLTTFITPVALLGSWNYIRDRQKEFYIYLLVMLGGVLGAFASVDLFFL